MTRPAGARREQVALGALVIVATVWLIAFGDALVKYVSADFSAWQLFVLRACLAVPLLLAMLRLGRRGEAIRRGGLRWVALRSLALILMWLFFYGALTRLSLPVIAAAYYSGPLFMVLLSALLTDEKVGPRRWIAVLVGFGGVLVVLRPGTEIFSPLTLLPVLSGFFYALAAVITRTRCADASPLLLSLSLNIGFPVVGMAASAVIAVWGMPPALAAADPFLFGPWVPLGLREAGIIVLLAVLIVIAGAGVAKAYQCGPPAVIGTFDYAYLAAAAFWSFMMFDILPDRMTVLGMILIAGAGMLAIRPPRTAPAAAPRIS
jgi:drug/metabolite transporter (DMT)-like permease